jgi:hypothetical protein
MKMQKALKSPYFTKIPQGFYPEESEQAML